MTTTAVGRTTLTDRVRAAIERVDDPEMPGVSIVELGLLHRLTVGDDGLVAVELLPTFSGCPALAMIRGDVERAVSAVDGVADVCVEFVDEPHWTVARVSPRAEESLARLGIAVERDGAASCPRCGALTRQRSLFGPTRCRAVHRCEGCGEVVEVMR